MISGEDYSYSRSLKSPVSDELVNTYLLRPLAGMAVRLLYRTPVTPNLVTVAGTAAGLCAAFLYVSGSRELLIAAGLCVTLKDLLDSVDGQLARAKNMYSRAGRFLDSAGDFLVNLAVFSAIGFALTRASGDPSIAVACFFGFWGITLRVSYHVFYQTAFLHCEDAYRLNRLTEEVREEDLSAERLTLLLQRVYVLLYNWQDTLMARIDAWSRGTTMRSREGDKRWYGDRVALRLSGFLGMGTELLLLMICSVAGELRFYLWTNLLLMNGVWVAAVLYRKAVLARRYRDGG